MELSEVIAGICFVVVCAVPIWISVCIVLRTKCPKCHRFWARKVLGWRESKKGFDFQCKNCDHKWKKKETSFEPYFDGGGVF
jgi:hypothetical protein